MKQLVKSSLSFILSPFHLEVVRSNPHTLSGTHLFRDLRILIESESPMCMDVGANRGQTITALQRSFTRPVIHAFEPSSRQCDNLKTSYTSQGVFIHKCAFGSERRHRTFFNYNNSCLSSFLHLDPHSENRFRAIGIESEERVQVTTVDEFVRENRIERVDLLKIDTQGSDLDVLLGASISLSTGTVKVVMCELNFVRMYEGQGRPDEIITYLNKHGFFVVDYYEKERQNNTLAWCTALFVRR